MSDNISKKIEEWKKSFRKSFNINKIGKLLKKIRNSFSKLFLRRKNLERDIFIIVCLVFISWLVIYSNIPKSQERIPEAKIIEKQPIEVKNIPDEEEIITNLQLNTDFENWNLYQNQWYGFEIKYPSGWKKPVVSKVIRGSKWDQKYEFRKANKNEDDHYIGYDIVVYNLKKVNKSEDTNEFLKKDQEDFSGALDCQKMTEHILEREEFPAERIFILSGDNCFESALFYNLVGEEYMFNIVPVFEEDGQQKKENLKSDILENFPEFYSAATTLNLIDIKRPKPVLKKPVRKDPMSHVFKMENGKRVCNHKNDHPHKSKQNKKKHMDMECCLDPDEIPNSNCYYDPKKYGKYL